MQKGKNCQEQVECSSQTDQIFQTFSWSWTFPNEGQPVKSQRVEGFLQKGTEPLGTPQQEGSKLTQESWGWAGNRAEKVGRSRGELPDVEDPAAVEASGKGRGKTFVGVEIDPQAG